jgi:uncharacterized repeat protein (TIGR03943 family)
MHPHTHAHDHGPHDAHEHGGEHARPRVLPIDLVEVTTILALALFLLHSIASGRLVFFLAPAFLWLPPVAALLLIAMAAARARTLREHSHPACTCECHAADHSHTTPRGMRILYVIGLLLPIALALAVHPTQFSVRGLQKRRAPATARDAALERAVAYVLGIDAAPKGTPATKTSALGTEPTVPQILAASEEGLGPELDGLFVTILGQSTPRENAPRPAFDLYRLVVTCCVADAVALSIEVVAPPDTPIPTGRWLRAAGILRLEGEAGVKLPVLHAVGITEIPPPQNPYL